MTPSPLTIDRRESPDTARRRMREAGIRHLPVLAGGRLVGLVSERDLLFLESVRAVLPGPLTVEDAMSEPPYAVARNASLAATARTMADHRYGAAIVVHHDRVVGVFTNVDALRALASLCDEAAALGVLVEGTPATAP